MKRSPWLRSPVLIIALFAVWLFVPVHALAASLSFSPDNGDLTVGQLFKVSVFVSSPDQAMNAVSADIAFPSGILQAISVSEDNSIVDQWVQMPSFLNGRSGGDVTLQGIVLDPGYTGGGGDIVDIVFRAIAPGDAKITFLSGSVLANDGLGTDIINSMSPADYTVKPAPVVPPSSSSAPVSAVSSSSSVLTSAAASSSAQQEIVIVSTSLAAVPPPLVTTNSWFGGAPPFGFGWMWLIGMILAAAGIGFAIGHLGARRVLGSYHQEIVREQKELREDLRRIQRELEEHRPGASFLGEELKHLEEDLKKDEEKS